MSQLEILKQAFEKGEELTVAVALQKYGIYALSQRVGELIGQGYLVDSETVTLPSGKHVSKYRKLRIAYG